MSDETNDPQPQPSDPPTNTGGGTTSEPEDYEDLEGGGKGDPPTNTGGGGNT